MYLRCDGTLDISGNTPTCTQWAAVTEPELLGIAVQSHRLNQDDYTALAGFAIGVFLMVVAVVAVIKILKR